MTCKRQPDTYCLWLVVQTCNMSTFQYHILNVLHFHNIKHLNMKSLPIKYVTLSKMYYKQRKISHVVNITSSQEVTCKGEY